MKPHGQDPYVRKLLALYRTTPGTQGRIRPADRRLAETLYQRGIPLERINAAFILAAARRTFRSPKDEPLQPIASLHYFLPVLQEIEAQPLDPGYVEYLKSRLAEI